MKLVLFDCDGTLVDSAATIHSCLVQAFTDFGYPAPSGAETRSIIGLSLDQAIARLLKRKPDHQVILLVNAYKKHFLEMRENDSVSETLYDGIAELIDKLVSRDDILIGMVTGKSRRGVNAVLETHDLARHFLTIRTADDCPSKPHPAMVLECCAEMGIEPSSTLVIGDAIYDMQMANAAKARAIGVAWGYAPLVELLHHGAEGILEHPLELLDYLG